MRDSRQDIQARKIFKIKESLQIEGYEEPRRQIEDPPYNERRNKLNLSNLRQLQKKMGKDQSNSRRQQEEGPQEIQDIEEIGGGTQVENDMHLLELLQQNQYKQQDIINL